MKRAAALWLLAAACAGSHKTERIDMPPLVVTAGPPDALAAKDEGQLFEDGTRLFDAGEYAQAARHFDRLVATFPDSTNWASALWNAALSQERLGKWQDALDRYERYLAVRKPGPDVTDAHLHAALCEHELGKLLEAAQRLHAVAQDASVPVQRRGEAQVQEAVCHVEAAERGLAPNGRAAGEKLLRDAISLYDHAGQDERMEPALFAQAEFWLGEIHRASFLELRLDPAGMDSKALTDQLESKAQRLLDAQGHYLRAIRRGDGEWATAAGFRIGELYETFHDQLVAAPVPKELTPEKQALYREELHKKVRVLVEKAMEVYEQTLAAAERVGARNAYVQKTGEALQRMRALLLDKR